MYERFKPMALLKKIDQVILDKYFGFSFFEIDDYTSSKIKSLKFLIFNNQLENVTLKINQKNLYNLELQRNNKLNGFNEEIPKFSTASLNYGKNNFNIKLRVKGDRTLHWYDKNQTSYRIDLRGDNRIWGLEEFSVQKPITRNYIYEYIFHKFLEMNNLIALKYFFINLSLNDSEQGIYAVEEGFSKELIERNKKRNGPIFGLEEQLSLNYPEIIYDLYSERYWQLNHSELINSALTKLNNIKNKKNNISQTFDLEKWATYFAIIDLTGNFHGSIPKSVKLYYNPTTAKFEPIGFDGHYNSFLFKDFLILDFLDKNNMNCSYICPEREWYLRFLNNNEFREIYMKKLKKISDQKLITDFYKSNIERINFYNEQFLSETSKKDKVYYKGIGLYIFDRDYLFERSKYIRSRIDEIEKKLIVKHKQEDYKPDIINLLDKNEIENIGNNKNVLRSNLEINQNLFLPANKNLFVEKGVKILFKKDVSLSSLGSISFNGTKDQPIIIYSTDKVGSLILANNNYKFKNVIFKNLSYPKEKDKILYGGVNIINSNLQILNSEIINSNSEDAINIISSDSDIKNLTVKNIQADAIDIDFGNLKFVNIICENIDNDCLDISGANVYGNRLNGSQIKDKGLSFGESAEGQIMNLNFQNSRLGVAVKDGSNLRLSKYEFKNNEYDIAVFNKKREYEGATLHISEPNNNNQINYLLGKNNEIIKNNISLNKKLDNKMINNLFY